MKPKYEDIIRRLQEKDFRLTDIRKAVIKVLSDHNHISINEIIAQLKKTNHSVNIMSIYNTIDLLLAEHIIHANIFENKQIFYEISDNVIHLVCNICHKIIHFTEAEIDNFPFLNFDQLAEFLKREKNFSFSHFNLEIHGICAACQNKIKKT